MCFYLCIQTCEQRQVSHFQYLSWPDYGVPTSAVTLIDFLGAVKRQQRKMVKALGSQWTGHPLGPPMVVHCSAGIGRTGEVQESNFLPRRRPQSHISREQPATPWKPPFA